MKRVKKADKTLHKFVEDGNMSDFTRKQVSAMVKELVTFGSGSEMDDYLRNDKDAVKDGILAAENQETHLAFVTEMTEKKVERVSKIFPRGAKLVRDST